MCFCCCTAICVTGCSTVIKAIQSTHLCLPSHQPASQYISTCSPHCLSLTSNFFWTDPLLPGSDQPVLPPSPGKSLHFRSDLVSVWFPDHKNLECVQTGQMHPVMKGDILADAAASVLPVWPSLWPGRLRREEGPPPKGWLVPVPDPRSPGRWA